MLKKGEIGRWHWAVVADCSFWTRETRCDASGLKLVGWAVSLSYIPPHILPAEIYSAAEKKKKKNRDASSLPLAFLTFFVDPGKGKRDIHNGQKFTKGPQANLQETRRSRCPP